MKKTLKALFLCLFLCLGILSLPIGAYAEEGEGEVKDIVQKVELYKEGEPIESGDVISKGDQFELKYTLITPLFLNFEEDEIDPNVPADCYIKKGDKIILPKFPKILTDYDKRIEIEIEGLDAPLGFVTLDDEGNILLEITNEDPSDITDVTFGISCKLNGNEVGDKEEIELSLPGFDTPIKLGVEENKKDPEPDPTPVDPPLKDKMKLSKVASETIERDGDDAILSWTIKLQNMGYDFDNFILYDKFKSDSKTDMKLISTSIKVAKDGADITDDVTISTEKGTADYNDSTAEYDFAVNMGTLSGESTYEVTYQSRIKDYDTYLKQNHSSVPRNETWFEYSDETHKHWSDIVKANGKLSMKPGIVKNFTDYDAATHTITWNVKANTSEQPLTNVKIREIIGDGQELIAIQDALLAGESYDIESRYTEDSENPGQYIITLGDDLKNKSLSFNVVTRLKESEIEFYSGNGEKKYKNRVEMNSNEMSNVVDEIEKTCKSTVLTKRIVGNYNYETHEFKYEIVANDNKMAMTKISVKDGLSESGLELIIATDKPIEMNGVELTKGTDENSPRPCYTYKDGVLTIYPEDAVAKDPDATKRITFTARVKDEKYLENITDSSINVSNNATLETEEYPITRIESKDAKRDIKNSMFNKKGEAINSGKQAGYTIIVNASQQELRDGCKVRDIIGSSLDLDESTVKLSHGVINPSTGDVTAGEEAEGYKTNVKNNSDGTTILEVTLPKNTGKNSYVLTYTANPDLPKDPNGDYSNKAELVDSGINAEFKQEIDLKNAKFSSGSSTPKCTLTLTKADEEDSSILLEGAVFSITDENGEEVMQLTTGPNGTKKVSLEKNKKYIAKEIQAPDGYEINEEPYEFETNKGRITINFTDKKKAPKPDVPNPGNNTGDNHGNNGGNNSGNNTSDNKNSGNASGGPSSDSGNNGSGNSGSGDKHNSDSHHDDSDNNNNNGNNNNSSNAAANTNATANTAGKNAAGANANADSNKPKIIVKAPSEYDDLLLSDEEIKAKGYQVVDGATLEGGDPNYEYIIGPDGEVLGARKKAVAGAKLAKTGGFVGTLVSYVIGGVAVLLGTCLLVINPRKARNRKRR